MVCIYNYLYGMDEVSFIVETPANSQLTSRGIWRDGYSTQNMLNMLMLRYNLRSITKQLMVERTEAKVG